MHYNTTTPNNMLKHELRVTNYEFRVTSFYLQVESLKALAETQKCELKHTR